jgi:adenylate cyclase
MRSLIQRLRNRLHRPWFGSGIGAVVVPIFGLFLLFSPFGKYLRDWSYDLPFLVRQPKTVADVLIVSLDDGDYTALNQHRYFFDRALHGRMVKRLNELGARLVIFDIVFTDPTPSNTNGTTQFATAMLERSNVVIGAQCVGTKSSAALKRQVVLPIEPLRSCAQAYGLVWVTRERDFSARELDMEIGSLPSLAWQAADLIHAEIARHPERRLDERWLNYYSARPFETISYSKLLTNTTPPANLTFSNKVVFIGETQVAGYVGEEREEFGYPWTSFTKEFFHGVELHALTYENLVRGDWLRRLPLWLEALLIVLAGSMLGYGLSLLRPVQATLAAVLACLLVVGLSCFMFARLNIWFPWLIIVAAQIPLTLGWAYIVDSIRTFVERKLLATSMELYLSPVQVKQILKQPELLKPHAREETVSILFSDIANFSKASEILQPKDLVDLLNNYYKVTIEAIHSKQGTVMNLIGDAIFAIWNAPQKQEQHRKLACEAALLLNSQVVQFNIGNYSIPLRTRIGLHTGIACVGNIGGPTHFDYAAVGESVNMASRLEGLNKKLKTNILATREIQDALDGALVSRRVGYFRFKGLVQINEVHELVAPAKMKAETQAWCDAFAKGLGYWSNRKWDKAEECFRLTLKLRQKPDYAADDDPSDGPSEFYLNLIPEFIKNPPPPEWLGEVDLRDK